MHLQTRKLLDRAFTGFGLLAVCFMAAALIVILYPIFSRGIGAYIFRGTVEFRQAMSDLYGMGNRDAIQAEVAQARAARKPVYDAIAAFKRELAAEGGSEAYDTAVGMARGWAELDSLAGRSIRRSIGRYTPSMPVEQKLHLLEQIAARVQRANEPEILAARDEFLREVERLRAANRQIDADLQARQDMLRNRLADFEKELTHLFGPPPGAAPPILMRDRYGQQRWDRTRVKLHHVLFRSEWVYDEKGAGTRVETPRTEDFKGTSLEPLFDHIEQNIASMMLPRRTFYWQFLIHEARDSYFFGGIWPAVLGTIYLTLGAMLLAVPMGVIAAIYLCEYARPTPLISLLRSCISTLAGVPSIVFGLFGLAFFLNTVGVSHNKSVLAGSLTLSLMILPTVIRASEEAILAVPRTFKEAALALGATRWRTVMTVVLPAALPGILTGIVISMGRAAGETAPIIFTAAVSVGRPLALHQIFTQPTQALPWNIYNLATEHEAVDEIRHVQFGMVFTLVALVLLLNMLAIAIRARMSRKLRG